MDELCFDLAVVGAGPAGLIAAIESHRADRNIVVLEKMGSPARKLKLTGNGRCNITNSAAMPDFLVHCGKNGRFLKHAFSGFFNTDLLKYFEESGVHFKLERGGRWFPESDRATEIVNALLGKMEKLRIPLRVHSEVNAIRRTPEGEFLLTLKPAGSEKRNGPRVIRARNVLLTTGGKSYPETGSTGTGHVLASRLGHTITPLSPSLVPLVTKGDLAKQLQGLSLKNVNATLRSGGKKVAEEFGEMLFTDMGVSGPIILTLSRAAVPLIMGKKSVDLSIDLKPALDHTQVDRRLLREIGNQGKKRFKTLLTGLLPSKMAGIFPGLLGIPEDRTLNQLTAVERKRVRNLLKEFPIEVTTHRSFKHAIITAGGVSLKEINPRTMESKIVKGLYFAGEILDIDADTGGFNLQVAFSTGRLAGLSAGT